MKNNGIEILEQLLEDALERMPYVSFDEMASSQPMHANWVTIDGSKGGVATDMSFTIGYGGIESMQMNLFWFLHSVISQRMLHLLRTGELDDLTIRLGSKTLNGANLNDDIGDVKLRYAKGFELGV